MIVYPTWRESYPEKSIDIPLQKVEFNSAAFSKKIDKKISQTKGQMLNSLDDFINKVLQNPSLALYNIKKTNPTLFSSDFTTTYTVGSPVKKELVIYNSMISDGEVENPILEAVLYAQKCLDQLSPNTYHAAIQYTTETSNLDKYTWPSEDALNKISKKDFLQSLGIPIDHCYDIEFLNIDIGMYSSVITVQKVLPF